MDRNLEALLRWGVENSGPPASATNEATQAAAPGSTAVTVPSAPARRTDLNTDVLDAIMGKSDAKRMKDCLALGISTDAPLDDRLLAWDELECLVELIDNANDLEPLGLWPTIVDCLTAKEEAIQIQACWVAGTATNNNPKAQAAFLAKEPLPTLVALINSTAASAELRSKAIYCLSAALRHNDEAVVRFGELHGWLSLRVALHDPSIAVRRKTVFLIHSLFVNSLTPIALVAPCRSSGTLHALLQSLSPDAPPSGRDGDGEVDVDFTEKAYRCLYGLVDRALAGLAPHEVAEIVSLLSAARAEGTQTGLSASELTDFAKKLSQ
ncbi:uncharacterized protein L969DRAFT_88935 [Mixia osmundae IAM 14324]|uniref:Nucleotide exchange factor Fes1 domain-containing protein n=1 Tax=Mixia osmundae (strain CBS 9802 / IAM 14324 / JCM 22182 / KY 12970) TaxID=764103 RepID=G7E7S5_MIXOS|nr:uncharacterized protein L969DRAFT_88935 [Mixia osmundae IAM 14324]KEI38486.1 hypothetical protein L969DRAFT_88935 [Mixia osmundae IAM 14324]GAA98885.1 hypothetical protein E5Q_05573 [Mixia osmundae IAM 14324]